MYFYYILYKGLYEHSFYIYNVNFKPTNLGKFNFKTFEIEPDHVRFPCRLIDKLIDYKL